MLAYVRDGRTIADHLIPAMRERDRMASLATVELPTAVSGSGGAHVEPIHISKHRRAFLWLHRKGRATDITVYHLWHHCG